MSKVLIQTTPTSYRIQVAPSGQLLGTDVNVYRHCQEFTEKEWDKRENRWKIKKQYRHYDRRTNTLFLPRYDLPRFTQMLVINQVEFEIREIPLTEGKPVELDIAPWFKPKSAIQAAAIRNCVNNDAPIRGIALQPGKGKANALTTYIKIPGGWKLMRDIKVGDTITAWDGTPTKVTGVYPQGKIPAYRVEFWDGRRTYVSGDHLWMSYYKNTTKNQQWSVRTTDRLSEILTLHNPQVHIPLLSPEEYPEKDFFIDPWLMGYILGNGGLTDTSLKISTTDQFIIDRIAGLLDDSVELRPDVEGTWVIANVDKTARDNRYKTELRNLGIWGLYSYEKYIPGDYFHGSVEQRWEMLRGLMDSDGTAEKNGSTTYSTSSKKLADAIVYLVRSLGGIARLRTKVPTYTHNGVKKQGRLNYIIGIRVKCPSDLFHLPRKKVRAKDSNQYTEHFDKLRIRKIEQVEDMEMQCISIDHPSRLYVCDDFIVTHNTATSLVAAAAIGRRFLIKTPILLNQWLGSVQKFLSVKEDEIYIISGSGSIIKLLQEIDKTIFPKVILASLQTLRDYANDVDIYRHIPPMTEFIERINVGVVIEDEVHMHFHAALLTDMVMTPKVLIPMSATFEVTSKDVHPIFEGHFPSEIRFGEDQYDRYVHVSSYSYTLPLHQIAKSQYRTGHGYMHAEFEKDMLKKRTVLDRIMDEVYMPILYAEYFNYAKPGEKLLIICSRTEMCAYIMKYLRKKFPDKKIDMFISGSKESVKTDNDIVVSTVKSSGVGFDMPNLITTFVTVAADSPPLNKQLLGRLRELNGREPRLAYASCLTITSHVKYMNTRRRIFPSLAKEFAHYAL